MLEGHERTNTGLESQVILYNIYVIYDTPTGHHLYPHTSYMVVMVVRPNKSFMSERSFKYNMMTTNLLTEIHPRS